MKVPSCRVDVAVIGGGIAGLWILARLRSSGYHAVLVEAVALGGGQTLASQGIIHGGMKYALGGRLSGASESIAAMPARWRQCLAGTGEVDLRSVGALAGHQYLIASAGVGRLAGFFASKAVRGRVRPLPSTAHPVALTDSDFRGAVYQLDEPVVATASLVAALTDGQTSALALGQVDHHPSGGCLELTAGNERRLRLQAQRVVLAAGAGNGDLSAIPMQRRPLHMVLMRAPYLPPLFGHFLGWSDKPRLTVTSHSDASGRAVWYLGGDLAETGVDCDAAAQVGRARQELASQLPELDMTAAEFATLRIDRAEGYDYGGRRPDGPVLRQDGAVLTVWPTKLALTPMLADAVLAALHEQGIEPGFSDPLPADWPRPRQGDYPWNREALAWN